MANGTDDRSPNAPPPPRATTTDSPALTWARLDDEIEGKQRLYDTLKADIETLIKAREAASMDLRAMIGNAMPQRLFVIDEKTAILVNTVAGVKRVQLERV